MSRAEDRSRPQALASDKVMSHSFSRVYNEGVEALLDRRYQEAYDLFMEARMLRPGDRSVDANLARLHTLGYGEDL